MSHLQNVLRWKQTHLLYFSICCPRDWWPGMGWCGQAVSELTHVQALTHPGMVPALPRAPEQSRKCLAPGLPFTPWICPHWAGLQFKWLLVCFTKRKRYSQHPAQIPQGYYFNLSFSLGCFNFPNCIQPHEDKDTLRAERTHLLKKKKTVSGSVLLDLWLRK